MTPSPPHPVAGLLLDLDGTLIDTEHFHYESTLAVLAEWDLHLTPEDFVPFLGFSDLPYWNALCAKFEISAEISYLMTRRTEEYERILQATSIVPLPGVLDLLQHAEEHKIPMAVASAAPRGQIAAGLEAAGLAERLPIRRSGHEDVPHGRGKPHPDVYQAAARALGVDPEHCIAIEDSANGMRAAQAAGCFTICVPCASHPTSETHMADFAVTRIDQVRHFLI
jgi:HAD superfamily hydrolase (TIGR01509 family)